MNNYHRYALFGALDLTSQAIAALHKARRRVRSIDPDRKLAQHFTDLIEASEAMESAILEGLKQS